MAKVPFGTIAPSGRRKPGTATLLQCRRGFLALIMHLGAWKADEMG